MPGGLLAGGAALPPLPSQPQAQPPHVVLRFCHQRDPASLPACSPPGDQFQVKLGASTCSRYGHIQIPEDKLPAGCLVQWMTALRDLAPDSLCPKHKAHAPLPVVPATGTVINPCRTGSALGSSDTAHGRPQPSHSGSVGLGAAGAPGAFKAARGILTFHQAGNASVQYN